MAGRTIVFLAALAASAGFAGCTAEDGSVSEETQTEVVTQPGTETIEVEVPTTDTMVVERTTTVDVDTTIVEGNVTTADTVAR